MKEIKVVNDNIKIQKALDEMISDIWQFRGKKPHKSKYDSKLNSISNELFELKVILERQEDSFVDSFVEGKNWELVQINDTDSLVTWRKNNETH